MLIHLHLPIIVKVSTDSIMKSCFQTSLILLEGLFIQVRCFISLFLLWCFFFCRSVILPHTPQFYDQPSALNFFIHWSYLFSSHPFQRLVRSSISRVCRPIFFLAIFGSFVNSLPPCHLLSKNVIWEFSSRILRTLIFHSLFLVFCTLFYLMVRVFNFSVFFVLISCPDCTLLTAFKLLFNLRLGGVNYHSGIGLDA